MALRNNNFGLFGSTASGGGGGSACVTSIGLCSGGGISLNCTSNPITCIGTFQVINACPYFGNSVIVLGGGTCSSIRCGVNNTASNYSASLSGCNNSIDSNCSTIAGGCSNSINNLSCYSFIGGGSSNQIISDNDNATTLGGKSNQSGLSGECNVVSAFTYSTIASGCCNSISYCDGFIGGGGCNTLSSNTTTILGGSKNSGGLSGQCNVNNQCYSSIQGGCCNTICSLNSQTNSMIGGGGKNSITSCASVILGGCCNNLYYANNNECGGLGATIMGGSYNNTCGQLGLLLSPNYNSFIGGGVCNKNVITNPSSICVTVSGTIIGGCCNFICNVNNVIGGGFRNCISGQSSNIIGGTNNLIFVGGCNAIGGGKGNIICASFSTIVGGQSNTIFGVAGAVATSIMGGTNNQITCTNNHPTCYSSIGGGKFNLIVSGDINYIVGGTNNSFTLNSNGNFIGGGCSLQSQSSNTIQISGKQTNISTNSDFSAIHIGCLNTSCSSYQVILQGCGFSTNSPLSTTYSACFSTTTSASSSCHNDINGVQNCIDGLNLKYNTILNGQCNLIQNTGTCLQYGLILNGCCNCIQSLTTKSSYATIINGCCNTIISCSGAIEFIGGGMYNAINGSNNTITIGAIVVGGVGNNTSGGTWDAINYCFDPIDPLPTNNFVGGCSFVGGGFQNNALCSNGNIVVGGCCNINYHAFGFIGGGNLNSIELSSNGRCQLGTIVGGSENILIGGGYNSSFSFIGGGCLNKIYDQYGTILGGCGNQISFCNFDQFSGNCYSFIGGGLCNIIYDKFGTILGGECNKIYLGCNSSILGGHRNCIGDITAYSEYSAIGGGNQNSIPNNSPNSTIVGGTNNSISLDGSDYFILGSNIISTLCNCTTYVNNLNIICEPICCLNMGILSRSISDGQVTLTPQPTALTSFGICSFDTNNTPDNGLCVFSGSPISGSGASGTICINLGKGDCTQYLGGDNQLVTFPNFSSGGGVSYYMNGSVLVGTIGGNNFYELSTNAVIGGGTTFTVTNNGVLSRYITQPNFPNLNFVPNGIWIIKSYFNVSILNADVTATIYTYDGTSLTLVGTSVPKKIRATATPFQYSIGVPFTNVTFTPTTRFAIVLTVTNSAALRVVTQYVEDSQLGSVSTTIPSGLGTLNTLNTPSQNFITTTNGTDFSITSNNCDHCFNLPTASATNRGALSTTDYTRFGNCLTTTYKCNSLFINPTNSSGSPIFCNYIYSGWQKLDPYPITFVVSNAGTQPPSGLVTAFPPLNPSINCYNWIQIGNMVTFSWIVCYLTPGNVGTGSNNITICSRFLLPIDVPRPALVQCSSINSASGNGTAMIQLGSFLNFCRTFSCCWGVASKPSNNIAITCGNTNAVFCVITYQQYCKYDAPLVGCTTMDFYDYLTGTITYISR